MSALRRATRFLGSGHAYDGHPRDERQIRHTSPVVCPRILSARGAQGGPQLPRIPGPALQLRAVPKTVGSGTRGSARKVCPVATSVAMVFARGLRLPRRRASRGGTTTRAKSGLLRRRVAPEVFDWLARWRLQTEWSDQSHWIFSTKSGRPMSVTNVSRAVRRVFEDAGLYESQNAILHLIRHTVAT